MRSNDAFTLVEVLIVMLIGPACLAALLALYGRATGAEAGAEKSLDRVTALLRLSEHLRADLDRIVLDRSHTVEAGDARTLRLWATCAPGGNPVSVAYAWEPDAGRVTRDGRPLVSWRGEVRFSVEEEPAGPPEAPAPGICRVTVELVPEFGAPAATVRLTQVVAAVPRIRDCPLWLRPDARRPSPAVRVSSAGSAPLARS